MGKKGEKKKNNLDLKLREVVLTFLRCRKASKRVKTQLLEKCLGEVHPTRVSHSWLSLGWSDNQNVLEVAPRGEQKQWQNSKRSQKSSPTAGLRRLPANPSPQSKMKSSSSSPLKIRTQRRAWGAERNKRFTCNTHWQLWEFIIWSSAAWELLVASAICLLLSKRWCWVFLLWFS